MFQDAEIESIMRAWHKWFQLSFWVLWITTKVSIKSSVAVLIKYTNDHPVWFGVVSSTGIYSREKIAKFITTYQWDCWPNCCSCNSVHYMCMPLFIVQKSMINIHSLLGSFSTFSKLCPQSLATTSLHSVSVDLSILCISYLLQYCLDSSRPFAVPYEFHHLFHFSRKCSWNFDSVYIESIDHVGEYYHKYEVSSHLFRSSFISINNVVFFFNFF